MVIVFVQNLWGLRKKKQSRYEDIPGFASCIARSTRKAFLQVVGAKNSNPLISQL